MSSLSTHVLDTAHGRPAAGLAVALDFCDGEGSWTELARRTTNADGRIPSLTAGEAPLEPGIYRLRFETGSYFRSLGVTGFYPEVQILVSLDTSGVHYHIPLLLSPFGFTTYRGS
ncbi:MAG TPA: hydroxyisourate hydrolase [Gemmataceae bacterium]|nr:hydroxyisourate hydrolase [Gemmataceae bacterium]